MLLVNVTQTVEVPHEEGESFELRKLSWKQLGDARDAQQRAAMARAREIGGELVKVFTEGSQQLKEAQANIDAASESNGNAGYKLGDYDLESLLCAGIAGWSYDSKVSKSAIGSLDETTAEWAGQAILDITKPLSGEEEKKA